MASPSFKTELLTELDRLAPSEQERVLAFARSLRMRSIPGTPAERVLELAVGIDASDLARIERAIEEGCELVEPHEW